MERCRASGAAGLSVRSDSLAAALELAAVSEGTGKLAEARSELEVLKKKWPKSAALHQRLAEDRSFT